ncbi:MULTISPECIES: HAMP domain-containing sensor histidine kinase [Halomonadaceae]|uniref:sensor histidine kinase n=1 Tax=Halomonadaceae TaxID=28256 RepID=UPI00159AB44E|nr:MULTISPECIES: HAMP domain-containing sensor histidine kinase [Halomonas]QJQ93847.1 HAMP domain-containing histidine kinase [Halomonas sp. PA5]
MTRLRASLRRFRRHCTERLTHAPIGVRLLGASLLLVVIVLPLAGVGLAYNFRAAVTAAYDERLTSLLNVVLTGVDYDAVEGRLGQARSLGDARFERVFSGWYWQITDGGELALTSRSLWDQRLPVSHVSGIDIRDSLGPRGLPVRIVERDIRLAGLDEVLHVSMAASRQELDAEVDRFERLITLSLLALAGLLLAGLAAQVRWGLAPLRRMHANLREVERGDAERLDTRLPGELASLAGAMNGVLERDRRLIERGRHAAGNLAHALKTPVSVLQTLSEHYPEASRHQIQAELARIDDAVRHHLARASAAGGAIFTGRVRLAEVVGPVLAGLKRLAARRGIELSHDLPPTLYVHIDPQDLQELFGNLLENALRWASSRVVLRAGNERGGVELCIEDDGPGMSIEQRDAALARGVRLDQRRSGSGLGLAIVTDLMDLYGGRLSLEASDGGGLRAVVWLPASRVAPATR